MSNEDTQKAIHDNIESVLVGLGYQLHDLSSDPDVDTTPLVCVDVEGSDPADNIGEGPINTDIDFLIIALFSKKSKLDLRNKRHEVETAIRTALKTPATLNIDDLAVSKLVRRIDHNRTEFDSQVPVGRLEYPITVEYREV